MDPLSIAASVVALITAAKSTVKFLEKVRSHSQGNVEVAYILNAVSNVVLLLNVVLNDVEDLRQTLSVPAFDALPSAVSQVAHALHELDVFLKESLLKASGKLSFRAWSGLNRSKLESLKQAVDDGRRNLDTLISSAQLRSMPLLQGAIESIDIVGQRRHDELSTKIDQVLRCLATGVPSPTTGPPQISDSASIMSGTSTLISPDGLMEQDGNANSSMVCVKTSIPKRRCDPLCLCRCHARASGRSPQWLAVLLGSMFYVSSGSSQSNKSPCNVNECRQAAEAQSHVTYYFPPWMIQCSLSFSTWKDLRGPNSSWHVSMPRVIPDSARCWDLIRLGKIEDIRGMLDRGEMSPYDVASDGVSVLRLAAGALQYGVCAMLAQRGASWMLKDRAGWSAADLVWEAILLYGEVNKEVSALQPLLTHVEDVIDLKVSTLHRIVSGQCLLSLEGYLAVDVRDIDSQDWLGKTPLMWASHRGDLSAVRTLLQYSAHLNIRDNAGKTSLHYAAIGGHPSVVKTLIDAGADARITERFSALPLHAAVLSNSKSKDNFITMAKHLIDAGCDLEHENYRPYTPIFYAVNFDNAAYLEALIDLNANYNRYSVGMCMTPLSLAIYHDRLNALEVLCKYEAESSWSDEVKSNERDETKLLRAGLNDILQMSAVFASVEAMEMLADSSLAPVMYDSRSVWDLFNTTRTQYRVAGDVCTLLKSEVAFQRLLTRKGIERYRAAESSKCAAQLTEIQLTPDLDDLVDVFVDALEVHV